MQRCEKKFNNQVIIIIFAIKNIHNHKNLIRWNFSGAKRNNHCQQNKAQQNKAQRY